MEPSQRLRSLRTLETIAFYKGYNFVNVREKMVIILTFIIVLYLKCTMFMFKIKPRALLEEYFPNGPPIKEYFNVFEQFDLDMNCTEIGE